jgi:hypothetical protein
VLGLKSEKLQGKRVKKEGLPLPAPKFGDQSAFRSVDFSLGEKGG